MFQIDEPLLTPGEMVLLIGVDVSVVVVVGGGKKDIVLSLDKVAIFPSKLCHWGPGQTKKTG